MKDASSSKHTRSGRHHRGWKERYRWLLLGPVALLMMLGAAFRRGMVQRLGSGRNADGRRRKVHSRRDHSVVHVTDFPRQRPAHSLGARLALVGTRDVRRRGPATGVLRAVPAEAAEELHDALISNLRLCLSPAAVGAVVDELNAKGQFGEWQLAAALNRLVELETGEVNVRRALAYGGLAVCREANARQRVIALKYDPVSGRMEWRHWAARTLEFRLVGPGRFGARLRERMRLRVSVHLDEAGQIVGWDIPEKLP